MRRLMVFVPDMSVLDNARMHIGNDVVLHMDLKDFFPSVRRARVRATFITLGYSRSVAGLLAGLCCTQTPADLFNKSGSPCLSWQDKQPFFSPHLPQGSPASPALAQSSCFQAGSETHRHRRTRRGSLYSLRR